MRRRDQTGPTGVLGALSVGRTRGEGRCSPGRGGQPGVTGGARGAACEARTAAPWAPTTSPAARMPSPGWKSPGAGGGGSLAPRAAPVTTGGTGAGALSHVTQGPCRGSRLLSVVPRSQVRASGLWTWRRGVRGLGRPGTCRPPARSPARLGASRRHRNGTASVSTSPRHTYFISLLMTRFPSFRNPLLLVLHPQGESGGLRPSGAAVPSALDPLAPQARPAGPSLHRRPERVTPPQDRVPDAAASRAFRAGSTPG